MKNNLFDKLKPEYKNIFEEKLKGEYPNYTKTITDYLKKEESIINVTYMVAGMICSMLGVQLTQFLLIFEDEDVTSKKEYCDTCEGEGGFTLSNNMDKNYIKYETTSVFVEGKWHQLLSQTVYERFTNDEKLSEEELIKKSQIKIDFNENIRRKIW